MKAFAPSAAAGVGEAAAAAFKTGTPAEAGGGARIATIAAVETAMCGKRNTGADRYACRERPAVAAGEPAPAAISVTNYPAPAVTEAAAMAAKPSAEM